MKKIMTILFLWGLIADQAVCGVVEDQSASGIDGLLDRQFIYNPAFLGSNNRNTSVIAMKDTKTSSVTGSPDNANQQISYEYKNDILGVSGLFPFGGGAAGISLIQINNTLKTDNSAVGRIIEETKRDDIYAFRFVIELTPSIDFGFHYQYKQAANHIFGSFFLDGSDKTNYKAFLSGYRLGFSFKQNNFGLGLYTAPALRGKALIDSEQKIVTEPGTGGAEFNYKFSEQLAFGLNLTRWFYKKDDRLEISTSPVDQRNISLNGIDFDQYLFPIQNIRIGAKFQLKQKNYVLVNIFQQESLFHFNEDSLPGDNRESLPSFRYIGLGSSFLLTRDRYQFEGGLRLVPSRSQSSVLDNSSKLGHRNYSDYKASERTFTLAVSFKN